jgi:anti-sigma B factor antagonist
MTLVGFFSRAENESAAAEMHIVCEQQATLCLVKLSGKITIDSSPRLREFLFERVESASCQSLTVDLYEVEYIDTSGLAVLVETLRAATLQGKALSLSRLRERPRYLLESTRLLHLFQGAGLETQVAPL